MMLNHVLKCDCMYILPGPLPGEAKACQPLHRFPRILGLTGFRGGKVCPPFYSQYLLFYSLYLFYSFPRILGLTGLRGGKVCPLFFSQYLPFYSLYLFYSFPRILGLTGFRGGKVCSLFYSQYLPFYSLYLFLCFFHQIPFFTHLILSHLVSPLFL
jgi:hypothetical protein